MALLLLLASVKILSLEKRGKLFSAVLKSTSAVLKKSQTIEVNGI